VTFVIKTFTVKVSLPSTGGVTVISSLPDGVTVISALSDGVMAPYAAGL
jgi:hypothetical protein